MQDTISRYLQQIPDNAQQRVLAPPFKALATSHNTQPLRTAGLVIKAGGGVLAKIGAADYYGVVGGRLVTIAASTDMTALTGLVITANSFNVACFFIDSASVVTVKFGTEGTALLSVKFPDFPQDKALVGFLIITHSATFTGGTTALDTATTVYVSPVGAFDPTTLFS
jgi:hypothetical protein